MEKQQTQVEPQVNEHDKKNNKKGQKKQKKQFKSEYVFDAESITINTQIPPLPKKTDILKKPQIEEVKDKEKKLREKVTKLIQQKKQIKAENYKAQKSTKKGEQNKHDEFKSQIQEVKELRQKLGEVKKVRNELKDKLHSLIEQAKANNVAIKQLGGKASTSKQSMLEKLQKLEHRLISDTLSKDDEKNLNNQIMLLKRKIKDAESVGNIEFKIAKAQERKEELDQEIDQLKEKKEPIEKEYNEIKEVLDKKNTNIDGLKKQLQTDTKQRLQQKQQNNKQWQKWKQNKKKRLDDIEQKIKKINEENDKLWEDFNHKKEAYWKQKHYIDWVEWQMKVKNRKVNQIEKEKRRQQYEQLDKQREKEENLQKYIGEIELCNFLMKYLREIKDEFNKVQANNNNQTKETVDVTVKLAENSEWKKEKGLELLKSKKSKQDEQAPKKGKKYKKRTEQKKEQFVFNIPYAVQNQFESLKVLAPSSLEQVDKKIEELRERELLFERSCQVDQVSEEDTKLLQEIKTKKPQSTRNQQKKVEAEDDFPTL